LGGQGISYALLFSALHEGMIALLVCLSSYLIFIFIFCCLVISFAIFHPCGVCNLMKVPRQPQLQ
jgi:hypothetical protein